MYFQDPYPPPQKKINGWGWRGGGQGMSERTFCLQTVGELMPIFCNCTMFQIMSNEYQQVIQNLLRIKTVAFCVDGVRVSIKLQILVHSKIFISTNVTRNEYLFGHIVSLLC